MATERVLSNLNLISFKTEGGLQNHIDELQDGDLAFTPDNSLKGNILDFKWTDHLLDDISWLRADTFSWQSGDVYVAAYNHLVEDFENIAGETLYAWSNGLSTCFYTLSESPSVGDSVYDSSGSLYSSDYVTEVADDGIYVGENNKESILYRRDSSRDTKIPQTDTIGDITITYYLAEDGHKICLPDQESNLVALYNATGIAWYYILDTANKQFKLPRTKYGFTGLRDSVGNYVPESLPNIRAKSSGNSVFKGGGGSFTGAFVMRDGNNEGIYGSGAGTYFGVDFDASLSSPTYQDNAPVQERATQMYLYFYVGNFERDAVEQTAGVTTETLNSKADVDLSNMNASQSAKETIVGWGMPDYTAGVALSDITPSNPYTATIDCVLYGTAFNGTFYINGNIVAYADGTSYSVPVTIKLSKGDTITTTAIRMSRVYMIPLKGAN